MRNGEWGVGDRTWLGWKGDESVWGAGGADVWRGVLHDDQSFGGGNEIYSCWLVGGRKVGIDSIDDVLFFFLFLKEVRRYVIHL